MRKSAKLYPRRAEAGVALLALAVAEKRELKVLRSRIEQLDQDIFARDVLRSLKEG